MNRVFEDSDLMARARISSWRSRRERSIEPSVMRSASREVSIEGKNSESSIIRSRPDLFQIFERHIGFPIVNTSDRHT